MYKMNLAVALCLVAALTLCAQGQTKPAQSYTNKYQNIEITRFDVKAGIDFPPEYLTEMMKDIANQLQDTHKFKQVARPGETLTDTNAPTIRLMGTVIKYQKGSRTKRWLAGPFGGKTKIVAHIKFLDAATGAVLLEKDVDGKVIIGVLGGESEGATNGVAKEIAKETKKAFF
ncbi:MAG TPA: DUF4410 domain-containing protein [Pyrinomonadaceae bacterium]|jgi:hypothetical protein